MAKVRNQTGGQATGGGGGMAGGAVIGGNAMNGGPGAGDLGTFTDPTTQPVPGMIKLLGYEYFEDFDLNGDGMINVTDLTLAANQGLQAVVAYGQLIITGQVLPPPRRPVGATGGATLTPSLGNQAGGTRTAAGGRATLGGADPRVSGVGSPAQAQQTAAIAQATAGGNATNYPLDTREFADKITDTVKVTAGYFTGLDGDLDGNEIYTMSLASSNEKYYANIAQTHPDSSSAETQFAITYGHHEGSGSDTYGSTDDIGSLEGQTEAIYKQLSSILLSENEITGGFKISKQGSAGVHNTAGTKDEYIYALIGKRVRFKDRINKKNWTLNLSGSIRSGAPVGPGDHSGSRLHLTDDSATVSATSTVAGPRYNIVSGTAGTVKKPATEKTYGWFYPEVGIMVFSGVELSASLPGPHVLNTDGNTAGSTPSASYSHLGWSAKGNGEPAGHITHSGFAPIIDSHGGVAPMNHLKLAICMANNGASDALVMRSEEDQTQINYFCRVKAAQGNFSNNPTFVSGSSNIIRNQNMRGNPTVYITGIGLNSNRGELVAVAKMSTPIKKTFSSEATIKVKLTY